MYIIINFNLHSLTKLLFTDFFLFLQKDVYVHSVLKSAVQ